MLGHHRLVEDDLFGAVYAGRQEGRRDLARLGREHLGVLRHGDRVLVDHAVEAFVIALQAREVADRAQVVAEMQIAGGLHPGENPALQAAGGVGAEMWIGCRHAGGDVGHGMWTPLKVEGRGVWTSAHPAGGGRGCGGIAQTAPVIKAAPCPRR